MLSLDLSSSDILDTRIIDFHNLNDGDVGEEEHGNIDFFIDEISKKLLDFITSHDLLADLGLGLFLAERKPNDAGIESRCRCVTRVKEIDVECRNVTGEVVSNSKNVGPLATRRENIVMRIEDGKALSR